MEKPGRLPLHGDRWTPFVRTLQFNGVNLTGATFRAQIRAYADQPGDPLIDLLTVTNNAQGIRLASVDTSGPTPISYVTIRINEPTMEGILPFIDNPGREPGADVELHWDMHITTGGLKQRWLYGTFTLRAGVTQ